MGIKRAVRAEKSVTRSYCVRLPVGWNDDLKLLKDEMIRITGLKLSIPDLIRIAFIERFLLKPSEKLNDIGLKNYKPKRIVGI